MPGCKSDCMSSLDGFECTGGDGQTASVCKEGSVIGIGGGETG